jgi:hypothetical protein
MIFNNVTNLKKKYWYSPEMLMMVSNGLNLRRLEVALRRFRVWGND